MKVKLLKTGRVTAHVDMAARIVHVVFHGVFTSLALADVYLWLVSVSNSIDLGALAGVVFDLRGANAREAAQRLPQGLRLKAVIDGLPAALIVANYHQMQVARAILAVHPNDTRKTIVWSEEEAQAFIRAWHLSVMDTVEAPRVG